MTELNQLTEHTWMLPPAEHLRELQPTIGVVCTDTATVIYDTGNSPKRGRELKAALDAINAPPVKYIVYSHFHWDHIFGTQVFDAPVIAHQTAIAGIDDYLSRDWSEAGIRSIMPEKPWYGVLIPLMTDDWDDFRIVKPTIVFDDKYYTVPIGGITLRLEHVGGKHSPDSVIMRVVEDRVMFLGDSFYPKPDGFDRKNDNIMIDRLLSEQYDKYIDGHRGEVFRVRKDKLKLTT